MTNTIKFSPSYPSTKNLLSPNLLKYNKPALRDREATLKVVGLTSVSKWGRGGGGRGGPSPSHAMTLLQYFQTLLLNYIMRLMKTLDNTKILPTINRSTVFKLFYENRIVQVYYSSTAKLKKKPSATI